MSTDLEAQRVQGPASGNTAILPDIEIPQGLRFLLRCTQLRIYRVPIEGESKFKFLINKVPLGFIGKLRKYANEALQLH